MIRRRLALSSERGQTIVLVVLLLPALLGFTGLAVDVGHAYWVQRSLQGTADAAALAGASQLPSVSNAVAMASSYGAKQGEKNALTSGDPVSETVTTKCLTSFPGCTTANAVTVSETATVSTVFARVLGLKSFSVHVKSTACGLCGRNPLNIALVVDRTGSMASNMSDLRSGLDSFLTSLDPSSDWVSLLVLPPAPNGSDCTGAATGAYPYQSSSYPTNGDSHYVVVSQSHNYLTGGGALNSSSSLVQQINCMTPDGGTAYEQALQDAQAELQAFPASRKGYQNVIVFETDGAANTAPDSWFNSSSAHKSGGVTFYPAATGHSSDILNPCESAVNYSKSTIQAAGTIVMTVAYNTQQDDNCYVAPYWTGSKGVTYKSVRETDPVTHALVDATTSLQNMATTGDAYSATNASEMDAAFSAIATKISGTTTLIDNNTP